MGIRDFKSTPASTMRDGTAMQWRSVGVSAEEGVKSKAMLEEFPDILA